MGIDLCDQLSSGILPSGDDPGDSAHRSVKFHGGGVFGLFFDLVLALTVGGSFYALAAYMMLTMLAAVLAQALKEKIPYGCIPSDFLFQSDDSGTVFLFINERNAEIFAALCFWNSIPDFSDSSFSVSPAAS